MMLVGIVIGIGFGIAIGCIVSHTSYQRILRRVGEEKGVEFILGKPYVIAPESYVRELEQDARMNRTRLGKLLGCA